MKILWLCALPRDVERAAFKGESRGSRDEVSWVLAHLPPPPEVELHIACLWPGGTRREDVQYQSAWFHVLPCPRRGRAATMFLFDHLYYRRLYDELRPDLVQAWGTEDSFGLTALRLAGERHVLATQGFAQLVFQRRRPCLRDRMTLLTEAMTLRRVRHVVAESPFSEAFIRRRYPRATIRAIDYPLRQEYLTATPSTGGPSCALFVGRITPEKGIVDCLTAFAAAAPSGWTLHVVGSGSVEEEHRLHHLSVRLGVAARFRHDRGLPLPDLIAAMQAASVFLLPTYVDCGPTALREAATMGLWPVCYDNSGPGGYIRQWAWGTLAADRQMDRLAVVLKEALQARPWLGEPRRSALINQLRHSYQRHRAWQLLVEFYREIIDSAA